MELLVDRVVVTGEDVEIRYAIPTSRDGPHQPFCHLRTDYHESRPSPGREMRRPRFQMCNTRRARSVALARFCAAGFWVLYSPDPAMGETRGAGGSEGLDRSGRVRSREALPGSLRTHVSECERVLPLSFIARVGAGQPARAHR